MVLFCKLKTAYEMRISDWSSDVCSSDLKHRAEACSTARALDRERITLQLESCYDRLGSKGDFMGVVAHICKQLLNVRQRAFQIGRASCRERVCQSLSISVVAVSLKKKKKTKKNYKNTRHK